MAGNRGTTFRLKVETESAEAYELARSFDAAEKAAKKLSDPSLSPRALQRAVMDSTLATMNLRDAMAAVQKTGGPIPPNAVASLTAYEGATAKAAVRSAQLKDALQDQTARSNQAAKGAEALAGSMGSLQGMLGELKNTTSPLAGAIGEMGFKMVAAAAAFEVGYSAGEKLRELYASLTNKEMPNLSKAFAELLTGANKYSDAEVRAGVITQGRLSQMHQKRLSLESEMDVLKRMIPELDKEANAAKESAKTHEQLELTIKRMTATGKDATAWALENATAIYTKLKPAVDAHVLSIESMSRAERAAYLAGKDIAEGAAEKAKSIAALTKTMTESVAEINKLGDADKRVADGMRDSAIKTRDAAIKSLNAMTISHEEYNRRKREINAAAEVALAEAANREIESHNKVIESLGKVEKKYSEQKDAINKVVADVTPKVEDFALLWARLEGTVNGAAKSIGGVQTAAGSAAGPMDTLAAATERASKAAASAGGGGFVGSPIGGGSGELGGPDGP